MRDFTKVSPSVWKSSKYRALGDDSDARLAYIYILTSPHANAAGCYDLPEGYGSADLGWDAIRYRKAIDRLCQVGLIEFTEAENTVRVTNWAAFNSPTNGKHAIAILNDLRQASCKMLKHRAFQQLADIIITRGYDRDPALAKLWAAYKKAFANPIAEPMPEAQCTRLDVDTDPDGEETETRREKTKTAQEREASTDAAAPDGAASDPPQEEEVFGEVQFGDDGNGHDEFPEAVQAAGLQQVGAIPQRLLTPTLLGKGRSPPPKYKKSDYDRRH